MVTPSLHPLKLHVREHRSYSSLIHDLTSDPEGEMGTLMAGDDGRDLSVSKGNSRRGFFFFSASRSRVSPEVRLGLSARIKIPVRKSTISSWK